MAIPRIMFLPYLQRWDGDTVSLRLLCAPQGDPREPLLPGEPAFSKADFQLEVRLVAGLGAIPTLTTAFTPVAVASPAPPRAAAICDALAASLPIDATVQLVDGRKPNTRFLKYAPPGYCAATGYGGASNPYVVTDDRYRCAVRSPVPSGTVLKADPPKLSWGKVMASALRQPLMSQAIGMVRPIEVKPPDGLLADGGWIYVGLAAGSPGAALMTTPDAIRLYAARVPPLSTARSLFTSVLFPVAAMPPAASYDRLFQEVIDYDDGFAKTVYAAQPQHLDPLQEDDDGTRPARDVGIRLGWDDEQIALWLNRQIDPAAATQDAPTGVFGYRVDGRKAGDAEWRSLVVGKSEIVLDGVDLGAYTGDFQVEIAPNQHAGDTSGTLWMPSYYANWVGPSLVGKDTVALQLQGIDSRGVVNGVDPGVLLRYGDSYEFRVRLVDHTGGGPALPAQPQNPATQPVATQAFHRWVPPLAVRLLNRPPNVPDPTQPPTKLQVRRPLLGYPAYVFAGGSAADLIADLPRAAAEKRGVGLPDPDVLEVEVTTQVRHPGVEGSYLTLYTTRRAFPANADATLVLDLDWRDVKDASTLVAPAGGALPLPTSRDVRLSLVAVGRDDAGYFGADDVRRGPAISVAVRKPAADERALYRAFDPVEAVRGIYLQPEVPVDLVVGLAQKASGKGLAAPDDALGRLATALDMEVSGFSLRARRGERVVFGCSPALRHVIGPDGASLTFASIGDLTQLWLVALRLELDRDWSWDGLQSIDVERDGVEVLRLDASRSVAAEALANAPRTKSELVLLDAFDPKPEPGQFPAELAPSYRVTAHFRSVPAQVDAPVEASLDLPITTRPSQIPQLASAGVALSPYERSRDYSRTEERQRTLWLEFQEPPENPADGLFARVLASAPDPALLRPDVELSESPEPPLPIDPELIRTIVPGQSDDQAGLGAMQLLVPTDSPRHFLLQLPPGLTEESLELFGFFTYELRIGHRVGWSTAQGRFSRPLRVTGVQHPSPTLRCEVVRHRIGIEVSAPFANPVHERRSLRPVPPNTHLWVLLYAQYVQTDGSDRRNVLLDKREALFRVSKWTRYANGFTFPVDHGTATWSTAELSELLDLLALSGDTPLSCLAIETLPGDDAVPDPVGGGLGYERFLRTSPLVPVPEMCI